MKIKLYYVCHKIYYLLLKYLCLLCLKTSKICHNLAEERLNGAIDHLWIAGHVWSLLESHLAQSGQYLVIRLASALAQAGSSPIWSTSSPTLVLSNSVLVMNFYLLTSSAQTW